MDTEQREGPAATRHIIWAVRNDKWSNSLAALSVRALLFTTTEITGCGYYGRLSIFYSLFFFKSYFICCFVFVCVAFGGNSVQLSIQKMRTMR